MKASPARLREFLAVEAARERSQSGLQFGDAHVGWLENHIEQRAQFPRAFTSVNHRTCSGSRARKSALA